MRIVLKWYDKVKYCMNKFILVLHQNINFTLLNIQEMFSKQITKCKVIF